MREVKYTQDFNGKKNVFVMYTDLIKMTKSKDTAPEFKEPVDILHSTTRKSMITSIITSFITTFLAYGFLKSIVFDIPLNWIPDICTGLIYSVANTLLYGSSQIPLELYAHIVKFTKSDTNLPTVRKPSIWGKILLLAGAIGFGFLLSGLLALI